MDVLLNSSGLMFRPMINFTLNQLQTGPFRLIKKRSRLHVMFASQLERSCCASHRLMVDYIKFLHPMTTFDREPKKKRTVRNDIKLLSPWRLKSSSITWKVSRPRKRLYLVSTIGNAQLVEKPKKKQKHRPKWGQLSYRGRWEGLRRILTPALDGQKNRQHPGPVVKMDQHGPG